MQAAVRRSRRWSGARRRSSADARPLGGHDADEDGGGGLFGGKGEPLDLRDMPAFQAPQLGVREAAAASILDLTLLVIATVGCFAVAFVAFQRYDVRPG